MAQPKPKIKHFKYDLETGLVTRRGKPVGTLRPDGYLQVSWGRSRYKLLARLAWRIVHGVWPEGQIDHINGIRADNRLVNLRAVTHQENTLNKCLDSRNKSGISGVWWWEERKCWYVHINRQEFLGSYPDLLSAVAARKSAEIRLNYHVNHGRVA